jgi:hypothetical protein
MPDVPVRLSPEGSVSRMCQSTISLDHPFTRPGQVAPDRPLRDRCMQCGQPEAAHAAPVAGPFETEAQARSAARHITACPPGTGAWQAGNHRLLCEALAAAGVELGAYDHRIVQWLAGYEPSTCAVIAGLISRARGWTGRRPAMRRRYRGGPRIWAAEDPSAAGMNSASL